MGLTPSYRETLMWADKVGTSTLLLRVCFAIIFIVWIPGACPIKKLGIPKNKNLS